MNWEMKITVKRSGKNDEEGGAPEDKEFGRAKNFREIVGKRL
jgi:hypothetical protein